MPKEKPIKKYKSQKIGKITPSMVKRARRLKSKQFSYTEIGKELGVADSSIRYHLDRKYGERVRKMSRDKVRNLTKEQLRQRNKKLYKKQRRYMKERYNNDEKFKKYFINLVVKSFNKRRKNWIKNGLCSHCGKERNNQRWKTCESCRKKSLENYYKN